MIKIADVLVEDIPVRICDNFITRLIGMLPGDKAIRLKKCNSIHTFWTQGMIDVYFFNKNGELIATFPLVGKDTIIYVKGASEVLEIRVCNCQ